MPNRTDYQNLDHANATLDAAIREQLNLVLGISSLYGVFLNEDHAREERTRLTEARSRLERMLGAKVYLDGWYQPAALPPS